VINVIKVGQIGQNWFGLIQLFFVPHARICG